MSEAKTKSKAKAMSLQGRFVLVRMDGRQRQSRR